MKRLNVFFAVLAAAALLVACNPGWNDDTKASTRDNCKMAASIGYDSTDANAICDCYVNKLVEKFPEANQAPADAEAAMTDCQSGYMTSMEKQMKADEAAEMMRADSIRNAMPDTMMNP